MRIVHCIWSLNTGGAETMLVDIANEQAKSHEVYVVVVNDSFEPGIAAKLSPEVKVIFNGRKPDTRSPWPFVKLNWTLLRLRPDIVHMHNYALSRVILPAASRGLFLTVHALQIPVESVRRGVRMIAISDAVKSDVQSRSSHKVRTIPNGIDLGSIEKRKPVPFGGTMRIVQVARLCTDKKGQDILVGALALLANKGLRDIEVDFIGCGPSLEILQKQAAALGVAERVNFLGLRDRAYIYSNLKDYDLMCHPARYEGFGLTVAEGIAAMLPVLVSDDGGPYEIIDRGKLGKAFKMESVEDCAAKIEYIHSHYQEVLAQTPEAYEKVKSRYSVQSMVEGYMDYYKTAL
jgi:glycosyltransferase involved in cell wall biosynthesis